MYTSKKIFVLTERFV